MTSALVPLILPQAPLPSAMRPEILAPAGDWDCLRAAVENGADAVYFGLQSGFNARARAANFAAEELPAVADYLHRRSVRGYVTLNTLIFSDELPRAESTVRQVAESGIDAVLVQDLGLARLIRAVAPRLPIHASTQMTLSSAECLEVARRLGLDRVVLPRELSVDEIAAIHAASDLTLEAFVHGALCVAYSGQCLTSESLGGRSANRGQCAQACRLPYDIIRDRQPVDTGTMKYLLSPQDLAGFELIPALIRAGVRSLKIEGRLKTPEYVANVTQHYRRAVDLAMAGEPVRFTPRQIEELELSFSRGFSPGWLEGCDHKRLVPGESSSKRGVRLGTVLAIRGDRVRIRLIGSVKRGDGLSFDCGRPVDDSQGGRVYELFRDGKPVAGPMEGGEVEMAFARDALDWDEIWPGQAVWKTDDPELTSRLRKTFTQRQTLRQVPVDIVVEAAVGECLKLAAVAGNGARCEFQSDSPLAEARRHPLAVEQLRQQFDRLGGTLYQLRDLRATIVGAPMVPFSVLGRMRHRLVEELDRAAVTKPWPATANNVLPVLRANLQLDHPTVAVDRAPQLHVLCRSLSQLRTVLRLGASTVYVDFQDLREYREATDLAQAAGAEILLATPRIQKPGEMGIFRMLAKREAAGILARNLAGIDFFVNAGRKVVADFSLNVTNELAAEWLIELGVRRMTASYDLNRDQLLTLASAIPSSWLEVVVHQHMPMFHMEHCVFCAVISPGTNKTNCGRPCDVHEVKLRDRIGMEHSLRADVGCRNTLFNAVPQSAAEVLPQLASLGIRDFRIELLNDDPVEIARTMELYRELLAGRVSGRAVWSSLRASNRVGVTRGTLEERRDPLAIL